MIYPADHRPAHVHVIKDDCEAVFQLNCPGGPPELRENHGFALHELKPMLNRLATCLPQLCFSWRTLHGTD